ncbi:MAG: hypothetical protein JO257_36220 [Deltaproteobacteria bacterium]|nr:hypothetical protein [Deltaproteobacteria bacterium]
MAARLSRVLGVTAAVAACGRVGFVSRTSDALTDTPPDAAAPPALVAMTGQIGSATGLSLPIARVTPGDLLVVAVVTWDGTPVASITDGMGSALTSANVRAVMANTSSELWYAAPATNATTHLDITMGGSATGYDVWALELSNVAAGPPAQTNHACLQYPPAVATAPVATTVPGELVIGATMLAYPAYANAVAAPFTALPFESGNVVAYTIAETPGSYGPTTTEGMGRGMTAMTCTSTIAFLPR